MTRNQKIWLTAGVIGTLGIAIGVYFYRRQRKLEGSVLTKSLPAHVQPAPIVGSVTKNGMRTTHYRAANMPIKNRVALIQDMVYKSVTDPEMRILAMQITRGCPERDKVCEARAIDSWVERNIRYAGDVASIKVPTKAGMRASDGKVENIDYYARAKNVVKAGAGDCDDKATLVATLLSMNDIESRLRVTSATGDQWSHIYVVANLNGEWVTIDTTLPGKKFGQEASYAQRLDFAITRPGDKEYPA